VEISKGTIVISNAGHDKDNFFVVTDIKDNFAYISDGKHKKLINPKKKSLKHLKPTHTVIDLTDLTDKKLRSVLNSKLSEQAVTN